MTKLLEVWCSGESLNAIRQQEMLQKFRLALAILPTHKLTFFLFSLIVCVSFPWWGEHENNDKDDSISGVQYFVPGTVLNTL